MAMRGVKLPVPPPQPRLRQPSIFGKTIQMVVSAMLLNSNTDGSGAMAIVYQHQHQHQEQCTCQPPP
jgi:hypothetical protein